MKISKAMLTLGLFELAAISVIQMPVSAQDTPSPRPTFEKDGTVHVPAFDLPPSSFMSKEAADSLRARGQLYHRHRYIGRWRHRCRYRCCRRRIEALNS